MGAIPVVIFISVPAIQEDDDPKYIHLQSQKVVLFYLYVQRKEASKFQHFYSIGVVPVKPTFCMCKIKFMVELLWP